MPHETVEPSHIAPPAANYAHGVVTTAASKWLHTAGVVPTAPDGSTPEGVEAQASVVWDNIDAIVADAGMGPGDVVSVVTYVVVGHDVGPAMAARDAWLGGRRIASTLVMVPALAQPQWVVEAAVVAAV